MTAPLVMVTSPFVRQMTGRLEAEGWRVVTREDCTEAERRDVRVIFYGGPVGLDRELLESMPNLGLIAVVPTGYDGVDVDWCRAGGIEVTHARGLNAPDVADHGLAMTLAAWCGIVASDGAVRAGLWREAKPFRRGFAGLTFGVVGLGAIGAAAAARAAAFGMQVRWWGPNPKPAAWPRAASLLALARESDVLFVATRADDASRSLISREVIEAVGADGLIVNVARGAVVDEDELIAALKDGRLGSAALDVFEEEPTPAERWAGVPNTLLTPHCAGGTQESVPRMMETAIDNARLFLAGEPVTHPVV